MRLDGQLPISRVTGQVVLAEYRPTALDCITMSAPLDAKQSLVVRLRRKEPEFGSYAGQLGTGHGVQ